jgi:Rod binding domain-containing protein
MMQNTIIGSVLTGSSRGDTSTPGTLRDATQEFESLFIAQMMKSMRGTVPQSGLMGSDSGQGIFREMLDQELSRQIAFAGGFGIGDMLYEQLKGK